MVSAHIEQIVSHGNPETVETLQCLKLDFLGQDLDSIALASEYPVRGPEPGGMTRSVERVFRFRATELNEASAVKNFRVWTPNNPVVTGISMYIGCSQTYPDGGPTDSPRTPELADTLVPTSDPGDAAPNVTIGGVTTGELTSDGDYTDYVVLQIRIGDTAESGFATTIYFGWQEVA